MRLFYCCLESCAKGEMNRESAEWSVPNSSVDETTATSAVQLSRSIVFPSLACIISKLGIGISVMLRAVTSQDL